MNVFELIQRYQVLQVGDFVLKSGLDSPVFFNFGKINTAKGLLSLGDAYRDEILRQGWAFDCLVGPAYKGIPIATATAASLARAHAPGLSDVQVVYNRKEAKAHGEKGRWVGELSGTRVVLVDDVLTAGTALSEIVAAVRESSAQLVGIVVGLDRELVGGDGSTALQRLSNLWDVPIVSLLNLKKLIEFYQGQDDINTVTALQKIV